jgi:hypothetical protein
MREEGIMPPKILNLNSPIDILDAVETSFQDIDFESLRKYLCPLVSAQDWVKRLSNLGHIVLISETSWSQAWQEALPFADESSDKEDRLWPELNSNRSKFEEKKPRKTVVGGVVEPLGIYVDDLRNWLSANFPSLVSAEFNINEGPAILLCPETMTSFSSNLYQSCKSFRKPFDSEADAFSFILDSVLLHEFGHHFFPTHRNNGGLYLNEALANLFAYYGLKHGLTYRKRDTAADLLVYKTLLHQPFCYSAYRPLNAMWEVDPHTKFVVGMCFTGSVSQWESLRGKPCRGFPVDLTPSRHMGICFDYEASQNLWYYDLGTYIGRDDPWLGMVWGEGLYFHSRVASLQAVSPDFIADLYECRHLNSWMDDSTYALGVFKHAWGYSPESRWPCDCLDWADIGNLDKLSVSTAQVLSHHKHCLKLNCLEQLSDDSAAVLGKAQAYGIEMSKIKTLTDEAVANLCGFSFFLYLHGLTNLSDVAALHLSKHEGTVSLFGLESLSDQAAISLCGKVGRPLRIKLSKIAINSPTAADILRNSTRVEVWYG